jgi:hypothetical protein
MEKCVVDFPTSHLGPIAPEGLPSYGNPERFYGTAIVAFVDLLGFSAQLRANWVSTETSALAKLLRVKDDSQGWARTRICVTSDTGNERPKQISAVYQARIHTVSDSIVVTTALEGKDVPEPHLRLAIASLFGGVGWVWERAVAEGFSVRGAVEIGDVYWTSSETIGPAFLDCYELENSIADWSRVILGPRLLATLSRFPAVDEIHEHLAISQDNLIELAPVRLQRDGRLDQLRAIQAVCGTPYRRKYDPLLATLTKGWRRPKPEQIISARSEIRKRIERKRKR